MTGPKARPDRINWPAARVGRRPGYHRTASRVAPCPPVQLTAIAFHCAQLFAQM